MWCVCRTYRYYPPAEAHEHAANKLMDELTGVGKHVSQSSSELTAKRFDLGIEASKPSYDRTTLVLRRFASTGKRDIDRKATHGV